MRAVRIGFLALLLVNACTSEPETMSFARISGRMPPISAQTLDGGRVEPSDYAGKVVVVNFWNQDCPPCRREMPLLQREGDRLRVRGVQVIGIVYVGGNWPNDPNAARAFLQQLRISYPNVLDESSELARRFDIAGIPSTIVVDRSGQMRFRFLGQLGPGQLAELLSMLDQGTD